MFDPTLTLFQASLGLIEPWYVTHVEMNPEGNQITIHIDFEKGAQFLCPSCKKLKCGAYDTKNVHGGI